MPSFELILITGCYLLILVFGTHNARTWAFSRHEAVTFECSAGAFLISLLMMVRFGFSWPLGVTALLLFLGFVGNAFSQWYFYMVLQGIIKKAFAFKAELLKESGRKTFINDKLRTMASVAIMPSFSRFIEESKFFNNPGGFIGLIKSIMKRHRFQKRKYMMRECFADSVNLIGPCKPAIDEMMFDEKHVVPAAIHANDLALDYKDEKKGLFAFDALGFGALLFIWFVLAKVGPSSAAPALPGAVRFALTVLILLLFTALTHLLRYYAFARYESFGYELSFAAVVASSFGIFEDLLSDAPVRPAAWLAFCLVLALFLAASVYNRRTDKKLHRDINAKFDAVIEHIAPVTETARAKRRFLQNLKTISEWAVVPFPQVGKLLESLLSLLYGPAPAAAGTDGAADGKAEEKRDVEQTGPDKKSFGEKLSDYWTEFRDFSPQKQRMPELMGELVDEVIPESRDRIAAADFRLDDKELPVAKAYIDAAGVLSLVVVAVCAWTGIL